MTDESFGKSPRRRLEIITAFVALSLSFANIRLCLKDGVLDDYFHYGEYFASLLTLLRETSFLPLTIHGAMDYVPGLLSMFLFGEGHYFFATEMTYVLLAFLGAVFLFALLIKWGLSGPQLILAGFLIPWVVDHRDFSLLLLIGLYFLSVDREKQKTPPITVLILLGLAGAFNFFWSTNRGIAGTISVGAALLMLAFKDRRFLLPVGVYGVTVLFVSFVHPVLSLNHYIGNLVILAKTSYQWGYGLQRDPVILSLYMGLMLVGASALSILRWTKEERTLTTAAHICLLLFLSIFYFQIGTNRADFHHIRMGLMAFLIGLSFWHSVRGASSGKSTRREVLILGIMTALTASVAVYFDERYMWFIVLFLVSLIDPWGVSREKTRKWVLLILAICFIVVISDVVHHGLKGHYQWGMHIFEPPRNERLAKEPMKWVADQLVRSDTRCVFDMTNSGIINALADLPACGRFSYISYADRKFGAALIGCREAARPAAVVYSSTYWSYAIDGRPMRSRYPLLDQRIRTLYPFENCQHGYCVRYIHPPGR